MRVWPAGQSQVGSSLGWVREPLYRLDISRYEPGSYRWNVAVVQATGEEPFWESLSDDSLIWEFEVVAAKPPKPKDKPAEPPTPAGGG